MPSAQSAETETQCLFLSGTPISTQLQQDIEQLWQMDQLPFRSEKAIIQSKLDQYVFDCLDQLTTKKTVNGVFRYVTPLLRSRKSNCLMLLRRQLRHPFDEQNAN